MPFWSFLNLLLNIFCISGYPHHWTVGTEENVIANERSCKLISVALTFSSPTFSKLSPSKLDLTLFFSSKGGGEWGWEVARFFILSPCGGVSFGVSNFFLFLVFFLFGPTLPFFGYSYRSPLLLDASVTLELEDCSFLFPFLATYLDEDTFFWGIVPASTPSLVSN